MGWGEGESDQHCFKAGIVSKGPWGMFPSPNTNRCHSPVLGWPEALTHGSLVQQSSPYAFRHISLQGRTSKEKRSEFHFGLFWVLFFLSHQSHSIALFRASNTCRTWRIPSCWMPRVKWIQCIFQGAWWKVLTDVDFSFVIQVLLKNHLMYLC